MKKIILTLLVCAVAFHASGFLSVAQAAQKDSFEQWLEKYAAWDQLEKQYAQEKDKDSPEAILKRAEVYLNLNSPKQALEIIEMTPTFADNATEAQRLWLGGQAHRALGDLSKSVLWFSQSATYFVEKSDMKRQFKNESGLENIWQDVWLKLYWSFVANHTLSRDSQHDALNRIREIGQTVWGNSYWDKANTVLNPSPIIAPKEPAPVKLGENGLPLPPFITQKDRELVAQAMASVSLERFEAAQAAVTMISNEPVRVFWVALINFMETGQSPLSLTVFEEGNYLKALAFWQGSLMAPYSQTRSDWVLGNPDSGPWTKFRNNLLDMPADEARKAIDNELGSMLISEETSRLLNSFKLALSMSNRDYIASSTIWNKIDKKQLPLALQYAGTTLFKENLNNILPDNPAKSFTVYPVLAALSGAAGQDLNESNDAPFWLSAPQSELKSLSQRTYPMDKLLLLAYWQQQFSKKPSTELAKRSAFLFSDTSFGINTMLFLADQAVRAKKLQLGAFYLNRIAKESLDPIHKMKWLDVRIRLELDSGRNEAAMKTFKQMTTSTVPVPVMTRLRVALLFQQKRDFAAAKKELMAMWENRADLTTTLQAETLFWLGEGEQALRNPDKALDYYLRLAWQYPQENIWALTAMYRASIIYEKRGKYETAKRLLGTVVRNADTKEQREAAKARIAAINKKTGKKKNSKKSVLVYPF